MSENPAHAGTPGGYPTSPDPTRSPAPDGTATQPAAPTAAGSPWTPPAASPTSSPAIGYPVPQPPPAVVQGQAHPYGASAPPAVQPGYPTTGPTGPYSAQPSPAASFPSGGYPPVGPGGYPLPPQPQAPRPSSGAGKKAAFAAVVLVGALGAGCLGGFAGGALSDKTQKPAANTSNVAAAGQPAPVIDRSSLAGIAAQLQPAVVVIQTNSGEGSGVLISSEGYIVTNNHVVAGARGGEVRVSFTTGKRVAATVVGTDPRTDLAVVKVANTSGVTPAQWADSNQVRVGDTVLAIGSPLGLQSSVTAGIVSALHRTITVGGNSSSDTTRTTIGDAIQTDAPINPGNSGGALVNTDGKVIGINSAIATSGSTGNIGVGFAISANKAKSVSEQIIKGGKVSHPFLGVNVDHAESGGARVREVEAGSPAAKAGLRVDDVITKIDNRVVSGQEDLVGAIQTSQAGTTVILTVVRDGAERSISVVLGEAS